jgi:hypothetical protein
MNYRLNPRTGEVTGMGDVECEDPECERTRANRDKKDRDRFLERNRREIAKWPSSRRPWDEPTPEKLTELRTLLDRRNNAMDKDMQTAVRAAQNLAVAAVTSLPGLLDRIAELERENARLRERESERRRADEIKNGGE